MYVHCLSATDVAGLYLRKAKSGLLRWRNICRRLACLDFDTPEGHGVLAISQFGKMRDSEALRRKFAGLSMVRPFSFGVTKHASCLAFVSPVLRD